MRKTINNPKETLMISTPSTIEPVITSLEPQEYDGFISLGSSCLIAFQLECRGLRQYSLPLDYVFSPSDNHIKTVTRCFINYFKNFCLYDNLVELVEPEERGTGNDIQYKDIYTEFRFIHHFNDYITNYQEYIDIKTMLNRRIERLYTIIEKSDRVLLLSDSGASRLRKNISLHDLVVLQKNCSRIFRNTTIDIHFTEFTTHEQEYVLMKEYTPNIRVFYTPQKTHCSNSFQNAQYSLLTHTMYNYLRLSDKGKEIGKEIQSYTPPPRCS